MMLLLLALAHAAPACEAGERVVFACALENGKELELCTDQDRTWIQYRYGRPGNPPELAFPADHANSWSQIHHKAYARIDGLGSRTWFLKDGVKYLIDDNASDPENEIVTLTATGDNGVLASHTCTEWAGDFLFMPAAAAAPFTVEQVRAAMVAGTRYRYRTSGLTSYPAYEVAGIEFPNLGGATLEVVVGDVTDRGCTLTGPTSTRTRTWEEVAGQSTYSGDTLRTEETVTVGGVSVSAVVFTTPATDTGLGTYVVAYAKDAPGPPILVLRSCGRTDRCPAGVTDAFRVERTDSER